jgi:hypothetical protein
MNLSTPYPYHVDVPVYIYIPVPVPGTVPVIGTCACNTAYNTVERRHKAEVEMGGRNIHQTPAAPIQDSRSDPGATVGDLRRRTEIRVKIPTPTPEPEGRDYSVARGGAIHI